MSNSLNLKTKISTPRYVTENLQNFNNKGMRKSKQILYKQMAIRLTADFSSE